MVESTASKRATLSSMFGSRLFKAFSLSASMTFQMSTRCTTIKAESKGQPDVNGKADILLYLPIHPGLSGFPPCVRLLQELT